MKLITLYQYSRWDGAERHIPTDVCFETLDEMKKFLNNHKYDSYNIRTFTVYSDAEEYTAVQSKELKDAALAKLTDLEKKALGLL